MMMGYYDINGYDGLNYDNLTPGGTAELSNYGNPGALANSMIASNGHIADFYHTPPGYLGSGDDTYTGRAFNSLADFMGSSQDSVGNVNGSTTFYYWSNGARTYAKDVYNGGVSDFDGMFGMAEYFHYSGYSGDPSTDTNFYSQYIDTLGLTYGFTFADYMAEINAGRPVMIQVEGHSMFGYGYNDVNLTIYLHDTWSAGMHSMTWGGSYYGMYQYGVACFTPTTGGGGAPVPEPCTLLLLGSGLMGLASFRNKMRAS
jgi:hypothetical protein